MKLRVFMVATLLVSIAAAQESPADVMARNILEWIQGIYRQGVRKTRQQEQPNAYLPPYSTQRPPEKPRPFQPASTQPPAFSNPSQNEVSGAFPDYGGAPAYSRPATGQPNYSPNSGGSSGYQTPQQYGGGSSTTYLPPPSQPASTGAGTGYPYPSPGNRPTPGFPTPTRPTPEPPRPTATGSISYDTDPTPRPGTTPTQGTNQPVPSSPSSPAQTPAPTPAPTQPTQTEESEAGPAPGPQPGPAPGPETGNEIVPGKEKEDDDEKHPPHIHSLEVQCTKTMMTINIEFNRAFNGVIYSKGFYAMPQCRYVQENSNQIKYTFTVNLDSCGTQFINDFAGEAGQAYLENVLVLQNEPGIQEVWDTVRSVRCLWEGNINKALMVSLSVDMLNQEIVTFSGDTATAKLDIQVGKGPFAPAANGLVKIGETMTLVVSVEGDPGFDLQVRDCIARDESSTNIYKLTDERGCILKPKLFGAFQTTKETGNTGASVIAYAFFQAFKFPDVMDLFIECNVELCKTNCEPCPEANQQIEPGRKKRSVTYNYQNWTRDPQGESIRVGQRFRVVSTDDLPHSDAIAQVPYDEAASDYEDHEQRQQILSQLPTNGGNVCLSYTGFYSASATILVALAISSLSAVLLYAKLQRLKYEKSLDMPRCS